MVETRKTALKKRGLPVSVQKSVRRKHVFKKKHNPLGFLQSNPQILVGRVGLFLTYFLGTLLYSAARTDEDGKFEQGKTGEKERLPEGWGKSR